MIRTLSATSAFYPPIEKSMLTVRREYENTCVDSTEAVETVRMPEKTVRGAVDSTDACVDSTVRVLRVRTERGYIRVLMHHCVFAAPPYDMTPTMPPKGSKRSANSWKPAALASTPPPSADSSSDDDREPINVYLPGEVSLLHQEETAMLSLELELEVELVHQYCVWTLIMY